MVTKSTETEAAVKAAIAEFAAGFDGKLPEKWVVEMAARIANEALARTREPEISVDVDGALSFDLELSNGNLLLVELEIDGSIDAGVYGPPMEPVQRMPEATEADIISWLRV